jgi:protein-S-isoprenylcysteine O-methyltransferase Ste14
LFGKSDFLVFSIIFSILFLGRPVSLILLGLSNADSLPLPFFWRVFLSLILLVPTVYFIHSVKKYFGIKRAFGADHFDPVYRDLPLVTEGIYKYTSNSMYTIGFFSLWIIAILFASKAALLVAGFSHMYIWVHYYTVEKPDMEVIYGDGD